MARRKQGDLATVSLEIDPEAKVIAASEHVVKPGFRLALARGRQVALPIVRCARDVGLGIEQVLDAERHRRSRLAGTRCGFHPRSAAVRYRRPADVSSAG